MPFHVTQVVPRVAQVLGLAARGQPVAQAAAGAGAGAAAAVQHLEGGPRQHIHTQ